MVLIETLILDIFLAMTNVIIAAICSPFLQHDENEKITLQY